MKNYLLSFFLLLFITPSVLGQYTAAVRHGSGRPTHIPSTSKKESQEYVDYTNNRKFTYENGAWCPDVIINLSTTPPDSETISGVKYRYTKSVWKRPDISSVAGQTVDFIKQGGTWKPAKGDLYASDCVSIAKINTYANDKIIIDTVVNITTNTTLNAKYLDFKGTGKFNISNGVTLTLNAQIIDTKQQIFNTNTSGLVNFNGLTINIRPEWFGAIVNNSGVDNGAAIQATINSIYASTSISNLVFSGADYYVSTPINIPSSNSANVITIRGEKVGRRNLQGLGGSTINTSNVASSFTLFTFSSLSSIRSFKMQNMGFLGNPTQNHTFLKVSGKVTGSGDYTLIDNFDLENINFARTTGTALYFENNMFCAVFKMSNIIFDQCAQGIGVNDASIGSETLQGMISQPSYFNNISYWHNSLPSTGIALDLSRFGIVHINNFSTGCSSSSATTYTFLKLGKTSGDGGHKVFGYYEEVIGVKSSQGLQIGVFNQNVSVNFQQSRFNNIKLLGAVNGKIEDTNIEGTSGTGIFIDLQPRQQPKLVFERCNLYNTNYSTLPDSITNCIEFVKSTDISNSNLNLPINKERAKILYKYDGSGLMSNVKSKDVNFSLIRNTKEEMSIIDGVRCVKLTCGFASLRYPEFQFDLTKAVDSTTSYYVKYRMKAVPKTTLTSGQLIPLNISGGSKSYGNNTGGNSAGTIYNQWVDYTISGVRPDNGSIFNQQIVAPSDSVTLYISSVIITDEKDVPLYETSSTKNIVDYAATVPTAGTYINGDFIYNTIPNNGVLGWSCTTSPLNFKPVPYARTGRATLVGGTVTVSDASITANSKIIVSVSTAGGTQGFLRVTRSVGTSFTITSTSGTETSVVDYTITE